MIYYSEDTLRKWLAERLGLDDVPGPLWKKLAEDVKEVLNPDLPEDKEGLLGLARNELNYARSITRKTGNGAGSTVERHDTQLSPDNPAQARAEALSLYWCKLAGAERKVEAFRRGVLGGQAVEPSEARQLLRSPAAAHLPASAFEQKGIPIIGHTAELLEQQESAPFEHPYVLRASLEITWAGGECRSTPRLRGGGRPPPLEFWDGEEAFQVRALPLSVLGRLYDVAENLAHHYPWEPSQAAWFVLTDEAPFVSPLSAHISGPDTYLNYGTITITAAHWLPEKVVSDFYSELKAKRHPAQTTSARRLAVFRFVVERSTGVVDPHRASLQAPSWRSLKELWNQEHPSGEPWHYTDVRNFRRDFNEAFHSMVNPFH